MPSPPVRFEHTAKPSLALDPGERADDAARRVLQALLDVVEANEPGLRAQHDPEFLHDFRVAVRQTRSVLGQLERVFPDPPLGRFREDFRWLGRATGPARDLDVYLLRFPTYQAWLPPEVRGDLEPLRAFLHQQQRAEHARLVALLDGARYRALRADWRAFLTAPLATPTAHGRRPIRAVVSKRIRRLYKKAVRQGRAILADADAPDADEMDAALHALRITCKKLRYLLELFGSLYPPGPLAPLINALKGLQDVLGEHNDLVVQRARLRAFAREMMQQGMAPADTFLAMGRLEAHIDQARLQTRAAFRRRFRRFARKKTRRRVRALFRAATPPGTAAPSAG
ncbi:MAG: CHAD domain-containing protein [Bacteroidetes bacterium]|nr:MAG: CHAD domain-containing protein [Bacteroidota bacterium]